MKDQTEQVEKYEESVLETDPFHPNNLRISNSYGEAVQLEEALTSVPVEKPKRQWFNRVHPDPSMITEVLLLKYEMDGRFYLVRPDLEEALMGEAQPTRLYTAINNAGAIFLWPIKLPDSDGRLHDAPAAAHRAAELSRKNWIQIAWEPSRTNYRITRAAGAIPEPKWPELELADVLKLAFKDRFIETGDHPIVGRLRGDY